MRIRLATAIGAALLTLTACGPSGSDLVTESDAGTDGAGGVTAPVEVTTAPAPGATPEATPKPAPTLEAEPIAPASEEEPVTTPQTTTQTDAERAEAAARRAEKAAQDAATSAEKAEKVASTPNPTPTPVATPNAPKPKPLAAKGQSCADVGEGTWTRATQDGSSVLVCKGGTWQEPPAPAAS